jgi:hypothetical protein
MYVPRGASVYPAGQSRQMAGGMGHHVESNVYVTSPADPHTISKEVGWQLGQHLAGVGV